MYQPRLTIDGNNIYENACNLTLVGDEFTFVATGTDMYFGQVINTGSAYVSSAAGNLIEVGDMTNVWYKFTNTNMNRVHITAYNSNKISLGYTGITGTTGTYTIPSNAKYISVRIGKTDAVSGTTYKTKFILASGTTIGEYEPYGSDKWYKKEYIGKYTFTGNETIDQFSSRTNTIRFSIANVLPTTLVAQEYNYNAYCNYLKAQDIYNNDVQGFFTHFNGISATRIYIGLDKTIASTSEQAKTWLGNVKPILYYQLRTPSDIEITNTTLIEQLNNLEKLKSYNGTTNISSSGNLPMILNVSAIKGES